MSTQRWKGSGYLLHADQVQKWNPDQLWKGIPLHLGNKCTFHNWHQNKNYDLSFGTLIRYHMILHRIDILSLSPFFFFLSSFLSFFLNYPGWYGWYMLCSILSIVSKSRPFTSFCHKVSVESTGIFAALLPISPISLQKEITFFILESDTSFLPAKFTCWTQPLYFPSQISVSLAPQPNTCKYICKYPARKQQRTF